MVFGLNKSALVSPERALPGRAEPTKINPAHFVTKRSIIPPFPADTDQLVLALGCFWGAERVFWQQPGVYVTAVGYAGGFTPNPTYEEVCSGRTGHAEVVLVVFQPEVVSLLEILEHFWEAHDPTQGMRQGNDIGTQYRSAIYFSSEKQRQDAQVSQHQYQNALHNAGRGEISTEISKAGPFYYAEDYHQQYLAKNPGGYCGLGGTGVKYR